MTSSAVGPTATAYGANEPRAKQTDPTAKSTPIHQPLAPGAHHVEPTGSSERLRCDRELHTTEVPSGRRNRSAVTNGHGPRARSRTHPSGTWIQLRTPLTRVSVRPGPERHRYAPRRREGADTRGNIDERRHDRGHRPHGHLPRLRRQGGPHLRRLGAVVARPAPCPRPAPRTSSSCSSTTSATPTSAATAARSPPRTSTPSPPAACGTPNFHVHPDVLADPAVAAHRARPARRRRRHRGPLRPRLPRLRHGARRRRRHPRPRSCGPTATPPTWSASGTWPRTPTSPTPGPATPGRCQRGFDRFYGFLDGFTNLHHPHRLVEDNSPRRGRPYPDGYYFTDDLTDRALGMIKAGKASTPDQPFFLYVAHGAVHAPLHAKADDIAAQRGRYDAGWDELRERALPPPARDSACVARGHRAGAPQHRGGQRRAAVGRAARPREGALRPVHGGLRRHGRQRRPDHRPPARRARRDGRARQHDRRSSPPTTARPARARWSAPPRTIVHLTAGDDVDADHDRLDLIGGPQTIAALPAGLGHGRQHAVPALQDQHPRRRPHRAVRDVVARPAASAAASAAASTPT